MIALNRRRVCRFGKIEVETPEHALLSCVASPEVASLRTIFLEKLFNTAPNLRRLLVEEDSIEFFKSMVYERSTIALVAKFAHEALQIFYAIPVFRWLPVRGIDVPFLSLVTCICCLSSTARRGTGCVGSA